jgi:hypothetical protein
LGERIVRNDEVVGSSPTSSTKSNTIRAKFARGLKQKSIDRCLLLSNGAVPVDPAALKEPVTHHAMAKQKKDDGQADY